MMKSAPPKQRSPERVIWLYGRSGAGKSTLARDLVDALGDVRCSAWLLDADVFRDGLCNDLGFTSEARTENHRRIAEVAKFIATQGIIPVAATMAPRRSQRAIIRKVLGSNIFWVYIYCPESVCMQRDPKGLYAASAAGTLSEPMDHTFEEPLAEEYDLIIQTHDHPFDFCKNKLIELVNGTYLTGACNASANLSRRHGA